MNRLEVGTGSAPQDSILIFGSGALAMLVGARMARTGASVTLAGTWTEGLETMRFDGIEVTPVDGETWRQAVSVLTLDRLRSRPRPLFDLAIIAVKSYQTGTIAPLAAPTAKGILTLQNGLGNLETLRAAAGTERVTAGIIHHGATLLGPGRVLDAGGGPTYLPPDEPKLVERFQAAGLDPQPVAEFDSARWLKLAVNCAINPLTALHGVPNGAILDSRLLRRTARAAALEVGRIAAGIGIDLVTDPGQRVLEVAAATANNRSSMLQDLENRRPTEIDALCGAVVTKARQAALEAPINSGLWRAIQEREQANFALSPPWIGQVPVATGGTS